MNEREELAERFEVSRVGIIRTPGKFQGEPLYTVYFYEQALEGGGGDQDVSVGDELYSFFELSAEDKRMWPELRHAFGVMIYESDTGFVNLEILTTSKEYDDSIEDLEGQAEDLEEYGEED